MKSSYLKTTKDPNVSIRSVLISLYIFISFFEYYAIATIGSVTKYYIFVVIITILLTANRLRVRAYHYPIVGWLGYKFLSLIWTQSYEVFSRHAITEVGFVVLLVCITSLEECENLLSVLKKSLWFNSMLFGVLSIFSNKPYEGIESRRVLSLFGQELDPNNVAAFLMFGFSLSLYSLLYQKERKVLHVAVIIINAYAILMTGSRAALVTIILIACIIIFTLYNPKTKKTNYLLIFPIALFLLVVAVIVLNSLPEDVANRLFTFEDYEGGSNRDIMWQHGLNVLSNPIHLLMGAGWGAYKADGGFSSLHNTFLSILCDTGLLGFSLLFVPVFSSIFQLLKRKEVLPVAIFISGMIPSFFIEAINKRFFWNSILFVLIAYNCHMKNLDTTTTQNEPSLNTNTNSNN